MEETLAAMDELVRAGKVRYPASSNYAAWQVCRMLWLAEKNGYRPARVTQPMYNLLARGIEQEFVPMCRELGVSTVVYNPLAGGLLTGKQPREAPIAGLALRRQRALPRPLLAPGLFRRGGGTALHRRTGGPFAGEPLAQLAAAPQRGGLRHPGRLAARTA